MSDQRSGGGKTIILCFDGTTNQYGSRNSNVSRLNACFSKDDPQKQITYYQPGLGQYYTRGSTAATFEALARGLDWAFAWSLDQHVIDGYTFLMDNWSKGDKVLIFGFSRGAYVARCVAGMVNKVGLLPRENTTTLTLAYRLFARTDAQAVQLASEFKKSFSRTVPIDFVGVFDTVASVGLLSNPVLPFVSGNNEILKFRHALALDECRFRFQATTYDPNHFTPSLQDVVKDFFTRGLITFPIPKPVFQLYSTVSFKLKNPAELISTEQPDLPGIISDAKNLLFWWNTKASPTAQKTEGPNEEELGRVKEVWFSGCHEDIGGSADANTVISRPANISLRWMIWELFESKIPLYWRDDALVELFGGDPRRPKDLSENLDLRDSKAPLHNWLGPPSPDNPPIWWPLELGPDRRLFQDSVGEWYWQGGINLGRPRRIQGPYQPIFHETVLWRKGINGYQPKAQFDSHQNRWESSRYPAVRDALSA